MRRPDKPAYVYRCYDADGVLIYIGSSEDVERRLVTHRLQSWWFDQVDRVESEEYEGGYWAAQKAEFLAIAAESPRWNIQGKPRKTSQELADLITSLEHSPNTRLAYNKQWIAKLRDAQALLERIERGDCPHCGQTMPKEAAA